MTSTGWFAITLGAAVAAAVLAAVCASVRDLSRARVAELASSKSKRRRGWVEAIASNPRSHAAALALPTVAARLAVLAAATAWVWSLRGGEALGAADIGLGLVAATGAVWVLVVLVGQSVAEHAGARTVVMLAGPIRAWVVLMRPAWVAAAFVDEVVRRLADGDDSAEPAGLDAELLSAVEESEREGQIDETERDMIEAVVEFRSTTVEQVMTPRTEIEAIEYTDDLAEVQRVIDKYGHSRVPVYDDNLDHIRGVLYAKDLLRWITNHGGNGQPFVLKDILREATFVPETKTIRELLAELLASRVHIAMVADEYGGTSGLVTFEDIVEEIFGEIRDEYETPEDDEPGVELDHEAGAAVVDARAHIDDTNDELEPIGLELPESSDYDTVGGLVTTTLGRIPTAGERVVVAGVEVEVLEAEPTRVVRVAIRAASVAGKDSAQRSAG